MKEDQAETSSVKALGQESSAVCGFIGSEKVIVAGHSQLKGRWNQVAEC